jgi:hypothetical protein
MACELHSLIRSGATHENIKEETLVQINELDEHGLSPLFYAVLNQNQQLISILLQKGAKTEIEKQTRSPLWAAAVYGDISLINQLIARQADAKKISSKGYSPIGAAIMSGRVKVLETLVPECDGNILLDHFTSEMKARTYEDPIPLRGEGMYDGAAVRDAIRAKHTSMALFLLSKGMPLCPSRGYPGGYSADTPFCLFEGLQSRSITPELAIALIKAGENPYARVTSQSNISRSSMMPTSAMEAAVLLGNAELVQCIMKNAEAKPGDFLGNLAIFANSSGSPKIKELSDEHFAKLHKGAFTYPMPPKNYRRENGSLRAFASRLIPIPDAPAEMFDGKDDRATISFYAIRGAKKHIPRIIERLEDHDTWQTVISEEIDNGLDPEFWDNSQIDAGELGKATDARVLCVLEILEEKEQGNTLICHLISSVSGLCFESLQLPEASVEHYDIALEITNAWRNWKERCEMISGKFHAIVIAETTDVEDAKLLANAAAHIPQWLLLTKKQSEIMGKSELIKSRSVISCQHEEPSADKKILALTLQDGSGSTITVKQDEIQTLNPFMVKSALAELYFKSKTMNDINQELLNRYMQRMYSSGYYESALFLCRILQLSEPTSNKFHAHARQQLGQSLDNFISYSAAMSGIRNSYYPIIINSSLQRIQAYHPLMMEYACMLNEELIIASKSGQSASDAIKPVTVGHLIRILAHYRFFLRPGLHPEFMNEMESVLAQLIKTAATCYSSDAQRLQLCIGIVGSELNCINRFDLHRCPSLRDFIVSEIIRLSKLGTKKSGPNLNTEYFDHSVIGECFQRVLESCCTPQSRASWDKMVGDSFNQVVQKSNANRRLLLEKEFFYADESARPAIAKAIRDLQCAAIRSEKVMFFTGVRLFELARYLPIQLSAPKLYDSTLWKNQIVSSILTTDYCNGEMMWHARYYHAQAAISTKLSQAVPRSGDLLKNYLVETPGEFYEIPANTREKIYLNPFSSSCTKDEILRQSKVVYENAEPKFGENKDIPDITAPDSLLVAKKISLLENGDKAGALLPINVHYSAEADTLYFSCMKARGKSTITIYDRKQQRFNAELVSINLKNGKILRQIHPDFDAEGFYFSESRHGHIVGGSGKSMMWVLANTKVQLFDSSTLDCKSLRLEVAQLNPIGRNHAFLDDLCFIQTEENESKSIREIQLRGKIICIKPDGTFSSLVDTRRSPALNDLDNPGNFLEGVFEEGGKIHVFTNQVPTFQRVNPMLGIFSADGELSSVERDATKVNKSKTTFAEKWKINNLKVQLSGQNYIYTRGLPGRLLIRNDKGKDIAVNIEFSGLSDEKMAINYPIHAPNTMIERQDEMLLADFVKTAFIRPQIIADNKEHIYLCAALWDGGFLPYVWRIDKKTLMHKIGLTVD